MARNAVVTPVLRLLTPPPFTWNKQDVKVMYKILIQQK